MEHSTHRLRSHLGRHLQQLALFTLPRLEVNGEEGEILGSNAGLNGRDGESSGDEDEGEELSELEFQSNQEEVSSVQGEAPSVLEEEPGRNEQ